MKKLIWTTILFVFLACVPLGFAWDPPGWGSSKVPYTLKTAAPAVTDDDFPVPFVWVNETTNKAYLLTDNAAGAAVWLDLIATAGSPSFVTISLTNELITAGSGTGITVNSTGNVNSQLYKVTTTYAAYSDSDTTKGIVICTLPAKTKILSVYADTTAKYTGGSTDAATIVVGITSESAAEIIASHDVFSGATTVGLADADMGTAMTRAAAIQGGYLPSWTGTTAIYATLVIATDILSNLTTGSTTFYIETERY